MFFLSYDFLVVDWGLKGGDFGLGFQPLSISQESISDFDDGEITLVEFLLLSLYTYAKHGRFIHKFGRINR